MKTAKDDSIFEQKLRRVENVMREEGISILDDRIKFDTGETFILADIELMTGFAPDIVSLPREEESAVLVLQEFK